MSQQIPPQMGNPVEIEAYGPRPIPIELDQVIGDFVRSINDRADFNQAVARLTPVHSDVLAAFAERMASLSVRRGENSVLRDALTAWAMAYAAAADYRDVLPALSLIYRACEIIHLDPAAEFNRCKQSIDGTAADALEQFLNRQPEDRALKAFLFHEAADEDGFRFVASW